MCPIPKEIKFAKQAVPFRLEKFSLSSWSLEFTQGDRRCGEDMGWSWGIEKA